MSRDGKFQMPTISSWTTSRHRRRFFPKKLAPDPRPLQYSTEIREYANILQGWDVLTLTTNTTVSWAFSGCESSDWTYLTDAVIFASRSTRCAVANMTLTGLASPTLIGLMGSQVSGFFEDLKGEKFRNLNGRFDGSGWLVGAICGKGYSPGLMWWRVVLTRFCKVSSKCGLTIQAYVSGKSNVEADRYKSPPDTKRQGTWLLTFFIGVIQRSSKNW